MRDIIMIQKHIKDIATKISVDGTPNGSLEGVDYKGLPNPLNMFSPFKEALRHSDRNGIKERALQQMRNRFNEKCKGMLDANCFPNLGIPSPVDLLQDGVA